MAPEIPSICTYHPRLFSIDKPSAYLRLEPLIAPVVAEGPGVRRREHRSSEMLRMTGVRPWSRLDTTARELATHGTKFVDAAGEIEAVQGVKD